MLFNAKKRDPVLARNIKWMKIVNWGFIESVHEYRGENFQWIFWIRELVDFWENKILIMMQAVEIW